MKGTGAKDGSGMSSKQLARTARDGKLLTFHLATGETIQGYLCGMDDYHWMIVTTDAVVHLIHKGGAILIDIASTSTYSDKHSSPELDKIIAPFRRFVQENYFGVKVAEAS